MENYGIGPRVALIPRYADATLEVTGLDLSATGDKALFNIPFKCNVVYAGCVVTTVIDGDAVVKFDKRHTAGGDTGRTDGSIANIAIPSATAIGEGLYDKAAQGSLTRAAAAAFVAAATCQAGGGFWDGINCQPHSYGELEPGNEVVVQIISGTTGKFQPILVVDMLGETMTNLENMTETV
jgi:hypothetical protein